VRGNAGTNLSVNVPERCNMSVADILDLGGSFGNS